MSQYEKSTKLFSAPSFNRLLAVFWLFAGTLVLAAQADRPNVIVILTDDQGYGDFGFTGNPVIRTPNLDAMAARSASMSQFYVSPVCAPTRASLMTGRYNFRTRAIDTWNGHAMMDPSELTIAEILRESGYATALFGKWHLGDNYPLRPQDQGFDEVLMHRGGGIGQPSDPDGAEGKYTDPILFHNGERKAMNGYCTDIFFDAAMDWMESVSASGKPFFIYLPTNAPHGPFDDVPEALYREYKDMDLRNAVFPQDEGHKLTDREDLDKRARIYAMITNIDDNVGRLMRKLNEMRIEKDTLVIFMVDNGPNGNRYVGGFKGAKTQVYEGGIRTPALFQWPGTLKAGHTSDRIAAHIDIAPTVLAACGVETPFTDKMDGRNLMPLLLNEKVDWRDRAIVIQAHRGTYPTLYHNFAIRIQRWKLLHASGFQTRDYDGNPDFELYDMVNDPYEMNNLADSRPEVLSRLKKRYLSWFADVGNTRPDNYAAPRIHINPDEEHPVVLTRQDGEHFNGAPFRPTSMGKWKLLVEKPDKYAIRFRFAELEQEGKAVLRLNGRRRSVDVAKGVSAVTFPPIHLSRGPLDLLPMLEVGDELYSPWKIDISR